MNSATAPESPGLKPATSGFVLAAAITVLFNAALAPLNHFMASLSGNPWTTHGLADLVVFAGLGFLITNTRVAEKTDPNRLIVALIGPVVIAGLGLVLWFALV